MNIGRPLSVIVLALAMMTVSSLVAASPRATPTATVYTRSTSCAGVGFLPIASGVSYGTVELGRTMTIYANNLFDCAVQLPGGATVTRVTFTLHDDSIQAQVGPCALNRHPIQPASTSFELQEMAKVGATGYDQMPGHVRLIDSTIKNAVVAPTKFVYALRCRIAFSGTQGNVNQVSIEGAAITYRISATNG
jgi:hypothetical protein